MTMEDEWTVIPGQGLGKLRFGMSSAQVEALSDTYGALTARMADPVSDDLLRDTLEKYGDAMSDEEKQEFLAAYAGSGPSADRVTETRGDPGLVLSYEADLLVEIMPAPTQRPILLDGEDLLSLTAVESLALLERLNGGPGRYADTEAAFDHLAMSVDGFCVTDRSTGVLPLDETDERFQGRTVMVRSTPYLPEGEIGRFIIHSVLG
ncbi:MAG: hypothetical protein K0R68_129 [Mycobacterium sp.]|jgi:hypothetical protein|nr:hypothetical protein [Mycobacterium sp.]